MAAELAVYTLLVGLASFRMSRLIGRDAIFSELRHRFYRRFPPDDHYRQFDRAVKADGKKGNWQITGRLARRRSYLGMWVDCPWCSSVWFAAATVAAITRYTSVPLPALVWAAACSVAGLCARLDAA